MLKYKSEFQRLKKSIKRFLFGWWNWFGCWLLVTWMTAKLSTFKKYLNFQKNITHQPLHFISGLQDECERMFFVAWQWHHHHHSMKETERQVPEYFVHKIVTYFDGGWNREHWTVRVSEDNLERIPLSEKFIMFFS